MFEIAFGLLFYTILSWVVPILFVLFVIVPICLNLLNRDGFRSNVRLTFAFLKMLIGKALGKD